MKKILINAKQKEEIRIALIKKKKLYNLIIINKKKKQNKFNIYKGIINRIELSLEAVFVNYGNKKNGFLPIKKIYNKKKISIGQELIIQIYKEARNNKCAVLTTFINLISTYIILMPKKKNIIKISKNIKKKKRKKIKKKIKKIKIYKNMGIIIRTSALNKSIKIIKKDLKKKIKKWKKIKKKFKKRKKPSLIYKQNNILITIFRDYINNKTKKIIIDNYKIYKKCIKYIIEIYNTNYKKKIFFYNKIIPLFSFFKIEKQIEYAFNREVKLPSGGLITIDITEALISIDVNSYKSNKENNIEITALNTNLEACKEISKQLRLRDLGGLIVIDFIDMNIIENLKKVEKKFKKLIKKDKAITKIGNISIFGLLEMSRQRLNISLIDSNFDTCPKCLGNGKIRKIESISLYILRLIQEKSLKKNTKKININLPKKIYNYFKKKNFLNKIKNKNKKITIIKNKNIKEPNFSISRIKYKKKKIKLYKKIIKKKKNIYKLNNNLLKITYKNLYKYYKNLIIKIKKKKKLIYNKIKKNYKNKKK